MKISAQIKKITFRIEQGSDGTVRFDSIIASTLSPEGQQSGHLVT